ncbi:hypothetical protein DL770_004637 [Monosporascus sp. CRB-9-2]|nr:hypothetical protein DL770_004637 [Monosporascus sp. CRB-9-2]
MGVAKKTRKFAQVKRVISRRDSRRKENAGKADAANAQKAKVTANNDIIREVPQMPSSLFFQFNENLKPPYSVLVDTNFLSHTVQRKLPLLESMMELEKLGPKYRIIGQALRIARDERWERLECDHKVTMTPVPPASICGLCEEHVVHRYASSALLMRIGRNSSRALNVSSERSLTGIPDEKGTYADDCIVDRVMKHRIYIVATNDKDLCRRIRKIPGVPIMNVARGKYVIERLPGAPH